MHIQQDFKELLALLEENGVDYMIVGGYAVAFHGFPRFTKDIDIFFNAYPDNIEKVVKALEGFGFSRKELDKALFSANGNIVTFGVAPVRVDFLNQIDGVEFTEAKKNLIRGKYGNIEVSFIGKSDLIKNKKSTSSSKDKADVEELS
ncbi:MAG: nucleotidyltransferase [Victivallaceae bacterium]|nr:nucleotidyltransferase [Victivallaceae bacterium]